MATCSSILVRESHGQRSLDSTRDSKRVGHNLATEQQQPQMLDYTYFPDLKIILIYIQLLPYLFGTSPLRAFERL